MSDLKIDTTDIRQGDIRLLDSPTAQDLLTTTLISRLAYTAKDGTPRVIPVNHLWNGTELVVAAFADTFKIRALQARPDVAVCIDTADGLPQVLMLRGRVDMTDVEGVLPEYAVMQRRLLGEEASSAYLAAIDQPGLRMVRIALRPTWVGVLDFQDRFPALVPEPVKAALGAKN